MSTPFRIFLPTCVWRNLLLCFLFMTVFIYGHLWQLSRVVIVDITMVITGALIVVIYDDLFVSFERSMGDKMCVICGLIIIIIFTVFLVHLFSLYLPDFVFLPVLCFISFFYLPSFSLSYLILILHSPSSFPFHFFLSSFFSLYHSLFPFSFLTFFLFQTS